MRWKLGSVTQLARLSIYKLGKTIKENNDNGFFNYEIDKLALVNIKLFRFLEVMSYRVAE